MAVFGNNNGTAGTVNLGSAITAGGLTFNPATSGTYTIAGGTGPFAITLAGTTPTVTTNADATISAVIAGSAGLVKTGVGTLTLSGANTYTGGTTINQGTLSVSVATNLTAGAANVVTINGGTLQYTGTVANGFNRNLAFGVAGAVLEAAGASGSIFNLNGTFTTPGTGARTLTLTGSTAGTGTLGSPVGDGNGGATSLVKNGTGSSALTGANTYTGPTTINAGTLTLGSSTADDRLPTSTTLTIAAAATFNLGNVNQTVAVLQDGASGGGTITNTYANGGIKTLTVGAGAFSGVIRDGTTARNTALTKNATGLLTLSGANTYTGATTVNGGTLLVNGTHTTAGAYSVNGGRLGGSGTITTAGNAGVTVVAGGGLIGGASTGTGLKLALGTGTLDISGAVTAANTQALQFTVGASTGALTLTSTSSTLNIGTGALEFDDFNFTAVSGLAPGTYTLFDTGKTIAGTFGTNLSGMVGSFNASLQFTDNGNDISLVVGAVPEPGTAAGCLALLGLLGWRERRRLRSLLPLVRRMA